MQRRRGGELPAQTTRPKDAVDLANAGAILDAIAALGAPPGVVAGDTVAFSAGAAPADACTKFVPLTVPRGVRIIRNNVTTVDGRRDSDHLD